MTSNQTGKGPAENTEAEALSDEDLDDVAGAGPISDTFYAAGKMAATIGSKSTEIASNTAGKAVDGATALAKDAAGAGDALLDGINDGLGGGEEEENGGGETDSRSDT